MTDLPEFVYLVTVDSEWPVSVLVDDNGAIIADRLERVVAKRMESANVSRREQVHVWKARLADVREVDLLPAVTTGPTLVERGDQP